MSTLPPSLVGLGTAVKGVAADSVIIEDLPSDDYHSDTGSLSCSMLKHLLISPAHFQLGLGHPRQPSDAMEFGTLIHLLTLQPELFSDEYVVYPGIKDARDKDFKAFVAKNTDRSVIDHKQYTVGLHLVDRLREATYKGRQIGHFIDESKKEVSIYATEPVTGIRLRTRPDIYHPDITFDLKSTCRSSVEDFRKDAVSMHYDMQAFVYTFCRAVLDGTEKGKPFVFLGVETEGPHSIFVATAGATFMENGAKKLQRCLALYKACTDTGFWPNKSEETTFEIEPWQQFSV